MHSESIAEWLIGRFTSQSRAAAVVGDLAETTQRRSIWWFWLSIARVLFALTWRRPLAFLAAFYTGPLVFRVLRTAHAMNYVQPAAWNAGYFSVYVLSTMLWIVSAYATVRYGCHDRLSQLALALTALATASTYFWWQPEMRLTCAALGVGLALASTLNAEFRKPSLAVLAAIATGVIVPGLFGFLVWRSFGFTLMNSEEMTAHHWMRSLFLLFAMGLPPIFSVTTVCSRLHDRMVRATPSVPEIEPERFS